MSTEAGPKTVVFRSRKRVRCQELWAVLDAAGIPAEIANRYGGCLLVVPDDDLSRALAELEDYSREGREVLREQPTPIPAPLTGGWSGILAYAMILIAVAGLAGGRFFGADWVAAGRAQAGLMTGGEWWRAVTALTLHVDGRHLMGNVFFGSVFGLLAAQGLGGGAAWLAILVGGVLGNAANAFLQQPTHSAIGASTAVFAGLGVLIAIALHHRRGLAGGILARFSPLVAGILLLAWTGMGGERTDVLAHVTGLVAGLVVGAASGLVPRALLERRSVQAGAALLAVALVAVAWGLALSLAPASPVASDLIPPSDVAMRA